MSRHWSCRCYYQNRPAGDPCGQGGQHGALGALGHHVGDPCSKVHSHFTVMLLYLVKYYLLSIHGSTAAFLFWIQEYSHQYFHLIASIIP